MTRIPEREISPEESIKVMCRVRPLSETEQETKSQFICSFPPGNNCVFIGTKSSYVFDHVFKPCATQEEVYNKAAKSIVADVLSGYNGTIFAYGQTSSGKTHTMEGEIENHGITPRIAKEIFDHISTLNSNIVFEIKVSYYEIYLEKIRDLLDISKVNLSVKEDKNKVPYVKDATERFVGNAEEMLKYIKQGDHNRKTAETKMNVDSSRSHSVVLIKVRKDDADTQREFLGKLYLVDLAGSENVSKSGAEGLRLDEAKNINKSLSALGNVISALAQGNRFHIPYRDSKLTRILQESIGGNARTTVIVCCSPASCNKAETKSTLEFGKRAKKITNVVCVNEELTPDEWKKQYKKEKGEFARLLDQLENVKKELERWRSGERVLANEQVDLQEIDGITTIDPELRSDVVPRPTPASPRGGVVIGAFSDERLRYEEECEELQQQLDEKDEEISRQSKLVEEMKLQMAPLEELALSIRQDNFLLQRDMNRIEKQYEIAKDDMKEILQVLDDAAANYNQKVLEAETKNKKVERLIEELAQRQYALNTVSTEMQQLKDMSAHDRKRIRETLTYLSKEFEEISVAMTGENDSSRSLVVNDSKGKSGEEFAEVHWYASKIKSEAIELVQRCQSLESSQAYDEKKIKKYEKDLADSRHLTSQHEARMKILQESIREVENKNELLEKDLDDLGEECAKKNAAKQTQALIHEVNVAEKEQANEICKALENEISRLRVVHEEQVDTIRDDMMEKQKTINELKDLIEKCTVSHQQIQQDYEKLKQEEYDKGVTMQETLVKYESREQARNDFKGLEEAVAKQLTTLHNLRLLFVHGLQTQILKSEHDEEGNDDSGSLAQREQIKFLEKNIEHMIRVHKQLLRDNTNMRCGLPKLEKRLKAAAERVNALESAVGDAKACVMKDRKRHQNEITRIKEAIRITNVALRGPGAQIVKPIRAGQPLSNIRPPGALPAASLVVGNVTSTS